MRMDENLTRFNSLFAGDGPNRLFVYFQAADRADEVMCRARNMILMSVLRPQRDKRYTMVESCAFRGVFNCTAAERKAHRDKPLNRVFAASRRT